MKIFSTIGRVLLGVPFVAAGFILLWLEVKPPSTPHTIHVVLYAALSVFGALVINADPAGAALVKIARTAGQFIPGTAARAQRLSGSTTPPPEPPPGPTP